MPTKTVDIAAGTVTFGFEDDTVQVFDLSKAQDLIAHLALHGASQKIGDSYAGAGKEVDPVAYAKEAVRETIAQLYAGTWRVTGGGGGKQHSLLILAVAEVSGLSVEEAAAKVEALSDDDRKKTARLPKIAAVVARMKAERAIAAAEKAAKVAAEAA